MAELELRKVERWHLRQVVLDDLSLKAPSGRITALLGDEESGRLTALKVIAGIEKPQGGSILIDGEDVVGDKEGIREAATVFRAAALMPHKTAFENIAYPLRIARFDREAIEARVLAVGEHFGLTDVLTLRPKKLTAIQCYQIGLARALVRDPAVYLFELPPEDERVTRQLAISEMKRLRDEFGRTVVYAAELRRLGAGDCRLGRRPPRGAQAADGQPAEDGRVARHTPGGPAPRCQGPGCARDGRRRRCGHGKPQGRHHAHAPLRIERCGRRRARHPCHLAGAYPARRRRGGLPAGAVLPVQRARPAGAGPGRRAATGTAEATGEKEGPAAISAGPGDVSRRFEAAMFCRVAVLATNDPASIGDYINM